MRTAFERWERIAEHTHFWEERNRVIAALIPEGAAVVDVGAGTMSLRSYARCGRYVPVDCVRMSPETVHADFNGGEIPDLRGQFDVAVCSGLLEYLDDPEAALRVIASWARCVIFSYCVTETISGEMRGDFHNHLSALDVLLMLARLELVAWMPTTWSGQSIFMAWPAPKLR